MTVKPNRNLQIRHKQVTLNGYSTKISKISFIFFLPPFFPCPLFLTFIANSGNVQVMIGNDKIDFCGCNLKDGGNIPWQF